MMVMSWWFDYSSLEVLGSHRLVLVNLVFFFGSIHHSSKGRPVKWREDG